MARSGAAEEHAITGTGHTDAVQVKEAFRQQQQALEEQAQKDAQKRLDDRKKALREHRHARRGGQIVAIDETKLLHLQAYERSVIGGSGAPTPGEVTQPASRRNSVIELPPPQRAKKTATILTNR
jgi:hypothetical protein